MKKAAIIAVMTLFFVILASCKDEFNLPPLDELGILKDGEFYAQNLTNGKFYKVKAERLYTGGKCVVWAETGSGVTYEQAQEIANEYENNIRPKIVNEFSKKDFTVVDGNYSWSFDDVLDFANELTGRTNHKLTILLLDIKDGYQEGVNDSYTAGYFYALDIYEKGPHKEGGRTYYSNGTDMIYMDTNPGLQPNALTQTYSTIAHELQHLVNFVTTFLTNRKNNANQLVLMDTWVNEGLSAFAEYLYLGEHPEGKTNWLQDSRNTIKTGNNFFVWGNHKDKPMAILDDYSTVYLFFQWLRLQAGTSQQNIMYNIEISDNYDYRAITNEAKKINPAWNNWEPLLRTWLAANKYPANSDYGYKGDTVLHNIIKIDPIGGNSTLLYPGEGVYSIISGSVTPAAGGTNIKYAGLDAANNSTIVTSPPYSGNTLLTFNANTNNSNGRETGNLTGITPSITSPSAASNARSAQQNGPYVIDAQDMLGRDKQTFKYPLPR